MVTFSHLLSCCLDNSNPTLASPILLSAYSSLPFHSSLETREFAIVSASSDPSIVSVSSDSSIV